MLGKQGLEYTYRKGRINVADRHIDENHAISRACIYTKRTEIHAQMCIGAIT